MKQLSILIPAYDSLCTQLVEDLHADAVAAGLQNFEILVAEDGTNDPIVVRENEKVFQRLSHVRHRDWLKNRGRAAIRNLLAREARYEWLLFVDSHMSLTEQSRTEPGSFLKKYLDAECDLVYGGYVVEADEVMWNDNLRYRYELASAHINQQNSYCEEVPMSNFHHFHTANFLIKREILLAHPFDENLHRYGYEDDLFGRDLAQAGLKLLRIDNPLAFTTFEENEVFVEKTEQALQTLHEFAFRMEGYSRLLRLVHRMERLHLVTPYIYIYRWKKKKWRDNLLSDSPSVKCFQLYKLGYFLSLSGN